MVDIATVTSPGLAAGSYNLGLVLCGWMWEADQTDAPAGLKQPKCEEQTCACVWSGSDWRKRCEPGGEMKAGAGS